MKPTECVAAFLFIGTMAMVTAAMKDDPSDSLSERVDLPKVVTEEKSDELLPNVHSPKRVKRCDVFLMGESCANSDVPGAGNDGDYFGGDETPGKRSFHEPQRLVGTSKNCLNLMGENCANGDVSGSGDDGGYFEGGDTPGKRSFHVPQRLVGTSKNCLNLMGENCANGDVPGSGDDGGYFDGGDTPGKRSFHVPQRLLGTSKNCLNLMGENCANDDVSGSGDDGDYFGGDDNPGKRSLRMFPHTRHNSITGAGGDGNYFGGDDSPGKRAYHERQRLIGAYQQQTPDNYLSHLKQLILKNKMVLYCKRYPGSRLCSGLRA